MSYILDMNYPMVDIQISRFGYNVEHTIFFMGNDHIQDQLEEVGRCYGFDEGLLVEIFNNTNKTYLTKCIGDYDIIMQFYDFKLKRFTLEGV